MEEQVASAIDIAWNPSSDQNLKRQAIEFLNQFRDGSTGWQVCLAIFVKDLRYSEVVRYVSLEVVNNAIQSGSATTNDLRLLLESLMQYIRQTYGSEAREDRIDSASIQNKISQTITFLFSTLYGSGWTSFFDDFLSLTNKELSSGSRDNAYGVILYLRILISIHDEIGDISLSRSGEEQAKANNLKDLIRQRDVQKIVLSWQEILTQWRTGNDTIVELCLKAVGSYVSWIDISLVVNQAMLDLLFQQLSRAQESDLRDGQEKVRDAAIDVFTEIVAKKMKAADKMQLISFLNLENVVNQLAASTPLQETRFTSRYDTDLAESVAKLVNITTSDIVKVLDAESSDGQVKQQGEAHLQAFLPLILRFFSDEYDEICSTVLPSVTELVSFLRKAVKSSGPLPPQYTAMVMPILKAVIGKMKYDETSSWGEEEDQTDEAEFLELRKRLASLQQSMADIDEQLYVNVITEVVGNTFDRLQNLGNQLDWRDLDLALHEMFLFGDLAVRQGSLYKKDQPNSPAAERLVAMMSRLVPSDIRTFTHPSTQLQYMEICVRYCSYFEKHQEHIPSTLENFLQLAHHPSTKVKTRAWYLFQRLVRHLRSHVGSVAQNIIEALSDLLTIKAVLPQEDSDGDEMSSEDHDQSADAVFNSQLYLFEAIGCASGTPSVPVEKQVLFAQTTMDPLFVDMERNLNAAKTGDEKATLQIHHDIMSLGTLARGYSDWVPGSTSSLASAPSAEVSEVFSRVAEATLISLESLKTSFNVRTAARFAFSRLVGVLGSRILPQLPRWIDGLLTQTSSKDEMALFLRLLDQVIFGFKTEIYSILDTLLTPFLQRVFAGMSEPTSGTDDEIQLAELKREYLNFLLVVLNNDLASVLVSNANQPVFETVISTLEHFARDGNDFPTAKMTFQVLVRMVNVWGGPDVIPLPGGGPNGVDHGPHPVLPGFDQFIMTKFSPLVWAIPTNPSFNPKDAQAKHVLGEMAALHKTVYTKLGGVHVDWVQEKELGGMGLNEKYVAEYLESLTKMDMRSFKLFFQVAIPYWLCSAAV